MCVNYETISRQVAFEWFRTPMEMGDDWREELYQDYLGPIIVSGQDGSRRGLLASYGLVPQRRMRPGERFTTMNARSETVGQLRHYKRPWAQSQLCLVPMRSFFEPNWEQEKHVRYRIGMADGTPFAVAGIWNRHEDADGNSSYSFTQLTINADEHALMRRFHKPGDEKRSLVIVRPEEYDDWLNCKDPEQARTYLQLFPAELMRAEPAPRPATSRRKTPTGQAQALDEATSAQPSLFD